MDGKLSRRRAAPACHPVAVALRRYECFVCRFFGAALDPLERLEAALALGDRLGGAWVVQPFVRASLVDAGRRLHQGTGGLV